MGKTKIQKNLNTFTKRVIKTFQPKQVLLFGSYARGNVHQNSDVDVVVIADTFKSVPAEKRLDVLYPLTADLFPDFHVFGFTPEEFNNASKLSTLEDVKKHAIRLL